MYWRQFEFEITNSVVIELHKFSFTVILDQPLSFNFIQSSSVATIRGLPQVYSVGKTINPEIIWFARLAETIYHTKSSFSPSS